MNDTSEQRQQPRTKRPRTSPRVAAARSEFEAWRESQQLEQQARPSSLFDPPAPATEAQAIKSVATNAGPGWMTHAAEAIRAAARSQPELTVDDVHRYLTEEPHDMRALGAAMRSAARAGVLERIPGQFRTSARPETHSRPLALWRSRIYGRAA